MKVLHNSCNIVTSALPDMYTLGPAALGLWVYISGRALVPVLQLLNVSLITAGTRALPDVYTLALGCAAPLGVVCIYQAKHSCLCYNLYIFI